MNQQSTVILDHNPRRPERAAWCARSGEHTAYARTRDEAIACLETAMELQRQIEVMLQLSAGAGGTAAMP